MDEACEDHKGGVEDEFIEPCEVGDSWEVGGDGKTVSGEGEEGGTRSSNVGGDFSRIYPENNPGHYYDHGERDDDLEDIVFALAFHFDGVDH